MSEGPWHNEKAMVGAFTKKRSPETLVKTVSMEYNGQKLD